MNDAQVSNSHSLKRRVIRKIIVLLAPLPDSPNCVSSMTDKASASMEPLDVVSIHQPLEKLKQTIELEIPRARLVTESENYLHYEFTSLLFRFVDGYSDVGANRKRIETIRAALTP